MVAGGEQWRPRQRVGWAMYRSTGLSTKCRVTGTAFFMKQLGGYPNKREKLEELSSDLRIREWPR